MTDSRLDQKSAPPSSSSRHGDIVAARGALEVASRARVPRPHTGGRGDEGS